MKLFRVLKLNKERGSATVEAIISFSGFLFVIFTILNVVNYCSAQMMISNAVDTATKELTQYAYFYKMSGLQKFSDDMSNVADVGAGNINEILSTTDSLYQSIGTAVDNTAEHSTNIVNAIEAGNFNQQTVQNVLTNIDADGTNISASMDAVMAAFGSVQDNPMLYMKSIVAVAGNEGLNTLKSHLIAAPLAKMFMAKHFGSTTDEASKKLEQMGVVGGLEGMNFNMSTIFSSESPEDVHIVVYYKLKLVQVFDWASLEVPLCKESKAVAWLGGDDVQVVVKPTEPSTESESTEPDEGGSEETTEEGSGETTEETTEESEVVDITNSYWHLDATSKTIAVNNGIYGNDMGIDWLHHVSYQNGCVMTSTADALKSDRPEQLFQSYTITKANDNTSDYIVTCITGAFKSIEVNLEAYDGETEVERTLYYTIYVPENISEEELEKIEAEKDDAEVLLDAYFEAVNSEDNNLGTTTAKHAEYEIIIIKAGGNYDYGSEE